MKATEKTVSHTGVKERREIGLTPACVWTLQEKQACFSLF